MTQLLLHFTLWFTVFVSAQAQNTLQFTPLFQNQPLQLHQRYTLGDSSTTVTNTQLRFYIGQVALLQDTQVVYQAPQSYYLLDAATPNSLQLSLDLPEGIFYNRLQFCIGVDSLTNAQGVQGGALDPMQGMYWTWQSGYINFKLEGTSTLCSSRGQAFQFHIGGFKAPYYPLQVLEFDMEQKATIDIGLAVDQLLLLTDLRGNDHIMSPNQKGVNFAQLFSKVFFVL